MHSLKGTFKRGSNFCCFNPQVLSSCCDLLLTQTQLASIRENPYVNNLRGVINKEAVPTKVICTT